MISIIVPSRYRPNLMQVCLDSIKLYTKDFELICIQEGINQELTDVIKPRADIFIHHKTPKGYSASLNAGFKKSKGEYVCFLNDDTVVTPGWMDEMLLAFEAYPAAGLVSPTFLYSHVTRQSPVWDSDKQFEEELTFLKGNRLNFVGVCYLAKREIMLKVGLWDEDFFYGGEDIDLCVRMNKEHSLIVARRAYIYHYIGGSAAKFLGKDPDKNNERMVNIFKQLEKKHNIKLL